MLRPRLKTQLLRAILERLPPLSFQCSFLSFLVFQSFQYSFQWSFPPSFPSPLLVFQHSSLSFQYSSHYRC